MAESSCVCSDDNEEAVYHFLLSGSDTVKISTSAEIVRLSHLVMYTILIKRGVSQPIRLSMVSRRKRSIRPFQNPLLTSGRSLLTTWASHLHLWEGSTLQPITEKSTVEKKPKPQEAEDGVFIHGSHAKQIAQHWVSLFLILSLLGQLLSKGPFQGCCNYC